MTYINNDIVLHNVIDVTFGTFKDKFLVEFFSKVGKFKILLGIVEYSWIIGVELGHSFSGSLEFTIVKQATENLDRSVRF